MTTILLVEDDEAITEEISDALRFEGYEVRWAGDGLAALQVMAEFVPDLVICDMMMPRLGGMGVLAAVREDARLAHLPFIFLTARTAREDCRGAMTAGADDFLSKPFTLLELLGTVRARLDRFQRPAETPVPIAPAAAPRPMNRRQAVTEELQRFLETVRAAAAAAGRASEFNISLAPRLFRTLPQPVPGLMVELLRITLPHSVRSTPVEFMAYAEGEWLVARLISHQAVRSPLAADDTAAPTPLVEWRDAWQRALAPGTAEWNWEEDHSLHVTARWPARLAAR